MKKFLLMIATIVAVSAGYKIWTGVQAARLVIEAQEREAFLKEKIKYYSERIETADRFLSRTDSLLGFVQYLPEMQDSLDRYIEKFYIDVAMKHGEFYSYLPDRTKVYADSKTQLEGIKLGLERAKKYYAQELTDWRMMK